MSSWLRAKTAAVMPPAGPIRILVISLASRSLASGIVLTVVVLFFTRSVGISSGALGLGLTITALLKIGVSLPAGRLVDVMGSRRAAILSVVGEGFLVFTYTLAHGFLGFVLTSCIVGMADSAAEAARGALLAGVVTPSERVRARSYLKSVNNIGISLGALSGGLALEFNTRTFYVALLLAAGALMIIGGLCYLALPQPRKIERPTGRHAWEVMRDRPYVSFGLINAILTLNTGILSVALPLWITERTHAPVFMYSVIVVLNTVVVVFFQVRASRGAEDVTGGALALRRCGVVLAACCGLYALAAGHSVVLAVVFLTVGGLVHTIGELFYSAGTWALAYELAPEHAQGQYQGMYVMTTNVGNTITPIAVTTFIIGMGWIGWMIFGVAMLAAGLAAPAVGAWGLRTRPSPGEVAALVEQTA